MNSFIAHITEPSPRMSPEMREFLYEVIQRQIERLFERFDIQRDGDEIHDLRKLVLNLATENADLWDKLKRIKKAKKKTSKPPPRS